MAFTQYQTPISQDIYPTVGITSTIIGFLLLCYLIMYQIAYKSIERSLKLQLLFAFLSAGLLSVGVFFLFLGIGIFF